MKTEFRYRLEWRNYTLRQRIRLWWDNVRSCASEIPPDGYAHYIEVRPGEPGYENAPYAATVDPNPPRFEFKDGQYLPVSLDDLKNRAPNPAYHDASPQTE